MGRGPRRPPTERALLRELRRLCLALPGSLETTTFGHPTWQAGPKRTFCVLERYEGALCIVLRAAPAEAARLAARPRWRAAPYTGRHGWVALDTSGGVEWERLAPLLEASFRLAARKADVHALDHLRLPRCGWITDEAMRDYHDREWGVPVHDETRLFEFLSLSGAQAGLSWRTVLHRRDAYRELFEGFEVDRVARFTPRRVERLLGDERILRNRRKIESTIRNARAARALRTEAGGLGPYLWGFVDGEPLVGGWRTAEEMPAVTGLSEEIGRDMKARGFSFVGPTIVYAFLQSVGIVNDHLADCFRFAELRGGARRRR